MAAERIWLPTSRTLSQEGSSDTVGFIAYILRIITHFGNFFAAIVTTKVSSPLFATKIRRITKARSVFFIFPFVPSKNFEPSWLFEA